MSEANASSVPPSHRWQVVLAASAFCLPFIIYYVNVIAYGVDVPIQDDFDIFGFLFNWLSSHTLLQKLQWLIMQHNEHRMAFQRLIALAEYRVSGRVDFAFLTLFGSLGWGLAVVLIALWLNERLGFTLGQLVPIPYLMLLFTQTNDMMMATAAIPFYWEMLFSMMGLLFLTRKKTAYACIVFVAALFTHGSGLLLFPLGVAYLLLVRRGRDAIYYSLWCLIFVAIYFTNYQRSGPLSLAGAASSLDTVLVFPLAFVGNIVPRVPIAVVVGSFLCGSLVFLAWRRGRTDYLALLSLWILSAAAVTALTRYDFGLQMAVSSRYAPFALLGGVVVYAGFLEVSLERPGRFPRPALVSGVMLVGSVSLFIFYLYSTTASGAFALTRQDKIAGVSLLAQTGDWSALSLPDQFKAAAGNAMLQAQQIGFYDYQRVLGARYPATSLEGISPNTSALGNVDDYNGRYISGWALIQGLHPIPEQITIVLMNGNSLVALKPTRVVRWDVSEAYRKPEYAYSGYDAFLDAYAVPTGSYRVGILVTNGSSAAVSWTPYTYLAP